MLRVVIIFLIGCCIAVKATNVRECSGLPFPLSVEIEDCEDPPCTVIKETNTVMKVHFVGHRNNIRTINTKITAKVWGLNWPYDLPGDSADVCKNLMYEAICPIDKEEDVTYALNFYVDPVFPTVTADVTISLYDNNNEVVSCFAVNIRVRSGPSLRDNTEDLLLEETT